MSRTTPSVNDLKKMSVAEQHEWLRRQQSRRNVLKGGLVGAGALLAGPALASPLAGAATRPSVRRGPTTLFKRDSLPGGTIAPFGRHIAFGEDPTTQMNVVWQVGAPVTNPFVRYGTDPNFLDGIAPAEITSISVPFSDVTPVDSVPLVPPTSDPQYYVKAFLNGLTPGQTYYYVVGHAGLDPRQAIGLPLNTFTTSPWRSQDFRFTAFGDEGVTYDGVATS